MSGVLLVADDGRLVEDLHGEKRARVLARAFSHLEHFAVAALAQHSSQLEIIGTGLAPRAMGIVLRYGYSFRIVGPVTQK